MFLRVLLFLVIFSFDSSLRAGDNFAKRLHFLFRGEPAKVLYKGIRGDNEDGAAWMGLLRCHFNDNRYSIYYCNFLADEDQAPVTDAAVLSGRNLSKNEAEELLWSHFDDGELLIYFEYPHHPKDASCKIKVRTKDIECSYWDIDDLTGLDDCNRLRKKGLPTIEEIVSKERFVALFALIPREITESKIFCYKR